MLKTSSFLAALTFAMATPVLAQNQPGAHFIENWDLDGDGAVTIEEARERRGDIFVTFDADDDGILTAEEYVMFDEARAMDMAENGLGTGNQGQKKGQGNGKGNGQGKGQGQGQGNGQGLGEHGAAFSMELQNADADGDGQVTLEEFLSGVDAWYPLQDRNGDGTLTSADFGPQ